MHILSSDVSLASSRISIATSSTREHLRQWDASGEMNYDAETSKASLSAESNLRQDSVRLSQPLASRRLPTPPPSPSQRDDTINSIKDEFGGDFKARIMKEIIEAFTGKKIEILNPNDLNGTSGDDAAVDSPSAQQNTGSTPPLEGWGIDYQYRESHYTKEGVAFSAAGTVTTDDGRSITFKAALEMSRETYNEINISLKAGDALKDPLVIDLTGTGAAFSDVKFSFDINTDGSSKLINMPKAGTGFLAYDRNGNGIVDDGSELFGPQSGNGFSELAQLDSDNNGWIDEGDSVFNSMKIWQKGADGTDSVTSLLQNNVGAIYTGKAATSYNLTTGGNALAGVLRESGVYLKEHGGAGVVQEVDLVV